MYRPPTFCILLLVVCAAATVTSQRLSQVTANTSVGSITGMQEHVELFGENYQLNVFRGIPYAEAPVGELRFKRPVSKAYFNNGFNATAYGDGCPQAFAMEFMDISHIFSTSEDCLSLNIYAPTTANATNKKPVMVFIHGGSWVVGASRQYDGRPLAAYGDVVLVTINYRLGPLGFLNTGDSNGRGNNGLFDELLALHWVKDNIGDFGGDAGVVTVFGESAGGVETSLHAISPLSAGKGLLHRAIPQSGAAIFPTPDHFAIVQNPLEKAKVLADFLGCTTTDNQAMVECLRSKSPENLMEKGNLVSTAEKANAWRPSVDGEFVPELPANLFTNSGRTDAYSAFFSIDLMIGSNSADGDVAMISLEPFLPKNFSMSKDLLVGFMSDFVKSVPDGVTKAILHEYVSPVDMNGVEGRDTMIDFLTDTLFIGPAVATAQTHTKMTTDAKTYMYFFDYALNNLTHSKYRPGMVAHGMELIYLFPSLDMNDTNSRLAFTDDDQQFSKTMMTYWTNFAKYGNPNGNMSDLTRPKVDKEWPEFTLGNHQYLDLGSNATDIQITARKDLRAEKMSFWLDYAPFLLNNTCTELPATKMPSPCPECVPLMDQQIGVFSITVGQAQTVLIVLAVCTAVVATLALMVLYACCKARKQLKFLKKGQTYHSNKAFESN
ncbi:carboxylesterase 5A-like [Lineus longissimus]|uniref:carboxylesterase 5A-like n=1 Tax=Lineus longissimus TaxID=88925 RepID=UPI00315C5287